MTVRTTSSSSDFAVKVTERSVGYNLPQKMGRRLWAPMWVMAMMAFVAAFIIGLVRSNAISSGDAETTIAALQHTLAGVMFIGFASVFAAVVLAIARILGEFRKGGGEVQEAVGADVVTPKMPATAKVMMVGMMMAMMAILVAVVLHFVWASAVSSGSATVADAEEAFIVLEAVRRLGVAVYLVSIALGLATITYILRFQAIRLRELAGLTD